MEILMTIAYQLKPALMLGCAGAALYALVWAAGWWVHQKHSGQKKKFPWLQAIAGAILLGWLLAILAVTVLLRRSVGMPNFHFFRGWREAWNRFTLQNWLNVLLNVAIFLPLGILLPLVSRRFRQPYWTLLTGVCLSLAIESAQLLMDRGTFDVDDIGNNSLGTILGWCLVMVVLTLINKRSHRLRLSLAYGAFPLLCVVVFGAVMGTYYTQEYGNLACAPTHRIDMHGITVVMHGDLPDFGSTAPIYYAVPFDRQSCDAYASSLLEALGEKFSNGDTKEILYYDNTTAYLQHATGSFLWINYRDRTFSYSYHDTASDEPEVAQANRETLETLLSPFALDIPQAAELTTLQDGSYQFTVSQYYDGEYYYDGSVTCMYLSDNRLWRVENNLIRAKLYNQESILTPAEALQRLEGGRFLGDALEYVINDIGLDTITVDNIALSYQVDSKGYYQPVYVFDLTMRDTYREQIMIPARK